MPDQLLDEIADLQAAEKQKNTLISYLKEIEAEITRINSLKVNLQTANKITDVAAIVSKLNESVDSFEDKVETLNEKSKDLTKAAEDVATSVLKEKKAIEGASTSYDGLIKKSVDLQIKSRELAKERKQANSDYDAGLIGLTEYEKRLANITDRQKDVQVSTGDVNRELRNLVKESQAAEGSLNELRAQLNLSLQTFDRLSASEKKSKFGLQLRDNILKLNEAVSDEEKATKRFQRNVGNYPSLDELSTKLKILKESFEKLTEAEKKSGEGVEKALEINKLTKVVKDQKKAIDDASPSLTNYGDKIKNLAGGFKTMIASLAGAGLALVGLNSIGDFLNGAVDEFNAAEQAASRFERAINAIGRGDILEDLNDEAVYLAKTLKQLDNDDITEVFQQLITYGKLTENQIKILTPVIIDFAAQQRISLEEAGKAIINGLEGNGRALKQYGLNIKDAGTTTEAFGIIMQQLAPKVEGAAKAFGETTAGQIAITKQSIADLKEEIGGKLQPVIQGFYSVVNQGLSGIKEYFIGLGNELSFYGKRIKEFALVTADVFTLDFSGKRVKDRKEAEFQENEAYKRQLQRNQAEEFANNIARENSKKTVEDQKKALTAQIALRDASIKNYNLLKLAGEEYTTRGKAASAQLQKDVFVVRALTKELNSAQDTRVLGSGDPNKRAGTKEKAEKKPEDFTNDILAAADRQRKAEQELNKLLIEEDSKKQERIIANEKNAEQIRLDALEQFSKDRIALINIDSNLEIKAIDDKLAQIKLIEAKPEKDRSSADKKLLIEKEALGAQRVAIEARVTTSENEVTRTGQLKRLEIITSSLDEENRKRLLNFQYQKSLSEQAYNDEIINLNKRYDAAISIAVKKDSLTGGNKEQLEVERQFAAEKLEIQTRYAIEVLKSELKLTEELLQLAKARGEDVTDSLTKISNLKLQISDLETKRILDNNAKQKADEDEINAKRVETLEKAREISGQLFGVLGDAVNASVTKQKNAIQDQINKLDEQKAKDIEVVNASTDSAQIKADKIAVINARAQAQKEQLELKQRRLDEQRARFEKAQAIASIILNTSVAVAKDIGNPFKVAFDIALGAAQLAIALSTPIPKFKTGLKRDYEGWGVVGDGGKSELIERADGRMEVTPAIDTLTYIKKGDRIHADADQFLNEYSENSVKVIKLGADKKEPSYDFKRLEKGIGDLKNVMIRKGNLHIHNNKDGIKPFWDRGNRQVNWIQQNTQS